MRLLLDSHVAVWVVTGESRLSSRAQTLMTNTEAVDPFDRLLVAQAMSEPLILLTHDRAVAAYGNTIVLI